MSSQWIETRATTDEEAKFCEKCSAIIEDVVVDGVLSSQQITEAMDD